MIRSLALLTVTAMPALAASLTVVPPCGDWYARRPPGTVDIELRCRSTGATWLMVRDCRDARVTKLGDRATLMCNGSPTVTL